MNIKPQTGRRNYAKGGAIRDADDDAIPIQPEIVQPEIAKIEIQNPGTSSPSPQGHNALDDDMYLNPEKYEPPLPRSGRGTARVSFKKYPGWPQQA